MDKSANSSRAHVWLVDLVRTRLVPALVVAPLALALVYLGGWPYFVFIAIILGIATLEYARLVERIGWQLSLPLVQIAVFLQLLAAQWARSELTALAMLLSIFLVLLHALYLYEKAPQRPALATALATIGAIVLLGWMGGHLIRLRLLPGPAARWTLMAVLSVWMADAGAYVTGSWFGRRKLAPRISSGKTVEGYLGGIILGTLGSGAMALLFDLPLAPVLILALLIAALSPVGDLSFSLLKREAGAKDSGQLFGGHGGVLDRMDSLLWAAAIAYYLLLTI